MPKPKLFTKLKAKWNIKSNWDFFVINLVFAMAGMSIVYVREPFFHLIGIAHDTPFIIKFLAWLIIVFPTYQINLLIFGFLCGQFSFFWDKEKKIFNLIFRRHKASNKLERPSLTRTSTPDKATL